MITTAMKNLFNFETKLEKQLMINISKIKQKNSSDFIDILYESTEKAFFSIT
jgi:hypothetical protein